MVALELVMSSDIIWCSLARQWWSIVCIWISPGSLDMGEQWSSWSGADMFHVPCILVFTVSSCQHSYAHVMGPPMHVVGGGAGLWKKSVMHACCCIPCFANSMKTIIEFYTFIIVIVKYYTDTLYDEKETKLRVCLRRKETCPWLKYIVVCNLVIQNGGSI